MHPGLIGDTPAPVPTAPHVDHIRYALTALAERGRGKMDIRGGRPAATWAWVFTLDGALAVSPEPVDDTADYRRDWTVSLDEADLSAEADKLTRLLHDDRGRSAHDPLFICFMDP